MGLIVYTWAPEAEGHGTDAFIDAFHNKHGFIRTRVPFIKGVTSIITLATGGSAGREGPIAQIGAGIGSWLGRTFNLSVRERRLMLLAGCAGGLGAFFAGVAKAPVGALLMVCEMTGGYSLVVPLMFTSVVAILLSQRWGLYEKQVLNKFHSPAHRSDTIINILQKIRVKEVFNKELPIAILPDDMSLAALKRFLTRSRESFFPVVDSSFHLRGILCLSDLREILFDEAVSDLLVLGELASAPASVGLEDNRYDVLVLFLRTGYGQIPIEDAESGVIGILRLEDLMENYHHQIQSLKEP